MRRDEKDFEQYTDLDFQDNTLEDVADSGGDTDLPPEYCSYTDNGCKLFGSCLNCPFPVCVYDLPSGGFSLGRQMRDQEIIHRYFDEQKSVAELAKTFRVTERTVRRALAERTNFPKKEGG